MRVVVDTNVFVSGLISARGTAARIVNAVLTGHIVPLFSRDTYAELVEVLGRPKLKRYLTKAGVDAETFLRDLSVIAEFVRAGSVRAQIRDPKDRPIVAVAASTPPPDFLVTGDRDFENIEVGLVRIVSPSWFVANVLKKR